MTPLSTSTRQKLQDSVRTNLNGQIILSQKVIDYMIKQGGRSIINISSMRGLDCPHFPFYPEAMDDQPVNYTTEKWDMVGLTKYMAGRFGNRCNDCYGRRLDYLVIFYGRGKKNQICKK